MEKSPRFQIKTEKSPNYYCNVVSKNQNKLIYRLFETLKKERISVPVFSIETGIPKDRVYKWKQEGTNPKSEDEKTINAWLNKMENTPHGTNDDTRVDYIQTRRKLKNSDSSAVPVYGGFTTLGNIEVIDDQNIKHKVIAELPTNVFPGCDYAEKAKGDSMYPLIMNQALLVGKVCPVKGIIYGEKYIIKTRDGLDTTKFIHPGSKDGVIKTKAYNKSVPDQEINIDDIVFVCRVHWIVNPT